MREYQVIGADRETGEDRVLVIEARHEQHAEEQAARMNVMVSRVKMLDAGRPAMQGPLGHWLDDRRLRRRYHWLMLRAVASGVLLAWIIAALLLLAAIWLFDGLAEYQRLRNPGKYDAPYIDR